MKKICLPALLLLTSTAIAQEIPSSLPVPSVDQFKKVCTAEKIKKLMINEHVKIQEEEALAAFDGPDDDFSQIYKDLEKYRTDLEKTLVVDLSVVSVMPTPLSFYRFSGAEINIPMQQVKYKLNKDSPLELTSGFYASEKFGCLEEYGDGFLNDANGNLRHPSDLITDTAVGTNQSSRSGQDKPQAPSTTPQVVPGNGTGR